MVVIANEVKQSYFSADCFVPMIRDSQ